MDADRAPQNPGDLSLHKLADTALRLDLIDRYEETVRGYTFVMGGEEVLLSHTYAHAFLQGMIYAHRRRQAQASGGTAYPSAVRLAV